MGYYKLKKNMGTENLNPPLCGGVAKPTYPGSPNAGEWICDDNSWVWIEVIGSANITLEDYITSLMNEVARLS